MEKLTHINSTAVPLQIEHVDTDQIIPARFLKSTNKEGFGDNLFRDWRYKGNQLDPAFALNNSIYSGQILVAGHNFGCGSSREHAAWALYDYGFRAVISSEFADIFKGNALNNGIIPIEVSAKFLNYLFTSISNQPTTTINIDMKEQTIRYEKKMQSFKIDPFKKECLMEGKDEFDYLMGLITDIKNFEQNNRKYLAELA